MLFISGILCHFSWTAATPRRLTTHHNTIIVKPENIILKQHRKITKIKRPITTQNQLKQPTTTASQITSIERTSSLPYGETLLVTELGECPVLRKGVPRRGSHSKDDPPFCSKPPNLPHWWDMEEDHISSAWWMERMV